MILLSTFIVNFLQYGVVLWKDNMLWKFRQLERERSAWPYRGACKNQQHNRITIDQLRVIVSQKPSTPINFHTYHDILCIVTINLINLIIGGFF